MQVKQFVRDFKLCNNCQQRAGYTMKKAISMIALIFKANN